MNHWHVQRHNGDDDIFATDSLAYAMDYASAELRDISEYEHEGISANGEQGDFECAYECFVRSERFDNLAANARNIHKQLTCDFEERAPLYRGNREDENQVLLELAAKHCISEINSNGPNGFVIYECADTECAPTEDED